MFRAIGVGVNHMLDYSTAGSVFLFGDKLGIKNDQFGVVFAFQVLPIIIFIASFFAVMYYLGVMPLFVRAMAVVMQKVMGTSGAESMNVAASVFMGQTEAPLTIRPFLAGMTQSELFTVMASGMAHISGRGDGGVCADRGSGDSPFVNRGDYDRPGDADARENADAGNGPACHSRRS